MIKTRILKEQSGHIIRYTAQVYEDSYWRQGRWRDLEVITDSLSEGKIDNYCMELCEKVINSYRLDKGLATETVYKYPEVQDD